MSLSAAAAVMVVEFGSRLREMEGGFGVGLVGLAHPVTTNRARLTTSLRLKDGLEFGFIDRSSSLLNKG
jgi:hypothetical protein